MTEQHPITPPPELVKQWISEFVLSEPECGTPATLHTISEKRLFQLLTRGAQWGADQELEACCEWLSTQWLGARTEGFPAELRDARRPKPPNLKDLALSELETILNELHRANGSILTASAIRRALERLKQLEDSND